LRKSSKGSGGQEILKDLWLLGLEPRLEHPSSSAQANI